MKTTSPLRFALIFALLFGFQSGTAAQEKTKDDQAPPDKIQNWTEWIVPFSTSEPFSYVWSKEGLTPPGEYSTLKNLDPSVYAMVDPSGVWSVWNHGKKLPKNQLLQKDGKINVTDPTGNLLHTFETTSNGYLVAPEASLLVPMTNYFVPTKSPAKIGLDLGAIDEALSRHLGIGTNEAILVAGVHENGAAEKAGLKTYDIITSINEEATATPEKLRTFLEKASAGDELWLSVLRRGESHRILVKVEAGAINNGIYGNGHSWSFALKKQPSSIHPWRYQVAPPKAPQEFIYSPFPPKTDPPRVGLAEVEKRLQEIEAKISELRQLIRSEDKNN